MSDEIADLREMFDIRGLTAVVTGGSGVLGSVMARALARAGASVAILSLHAASASTVAAEIQEHGGTSVGMACNVQDRHALEQAHAEVLARFGSIDILVNAAGGNSPQASTSPETSFFDLDMQAVNTVFDLNFTGTFQACQVFGRSMAAQGRGSIVNITSMSALRPLTHVPAYSAAKAAVANFTQWLAVHMAQECGPHLRVNALAPGFFLTVQNRFLLTAAESGALTARGRSILQHTPAGRFGVPTDLVGTLLWLVSPASAFVTGVVVPVDGGFAAYSGI